MKILSILIPSIFLSFFCSAQLIEKALEKAYQNNNADTLFKIIETFHSKTEASKYTVIDSLATSFFAHYVEDLSVYTHKSEHLKNFYTTKNMFLQDQVQIWTVDKINFDAIGKALRAPTKGPIQNGFAFYSLYPDTVYHPRNWAYKIINADNYAYKPYIMGGLENLINNFLNKPGFLTNENIKEHRKRALFIKRIINLNSYNPLNSDDYNYKNITYGFIHDFDIDRIILNTKGDKAVIQFRKRTENCCQTWCEYLFEKKQGKWVFVKRVKNAQA